MSATADDTQLIVNLTTSASPETFTLTDIGKITFSESGLTVYTADGITVPYAYGEVRNTARAAVYSISGTAVMSIDKWDGTPIPTDGLAGGVYIFNVDNNTIKFTKQ